MTKICRVRSKAVDVTEDDVVEHPEAGTTTGCHCLSTWRGEALDKREAIDEPSKALNEETSSKQNGTAKI